VNSSAAILNASFLGAYKEKMTWKAPEYIVSSHSFPPNQDVALPIEQCLAVAEQTAIPI
jgi:hypothetical protein